MNRTLLELFSYEHKDMERLNSKKDLYSLSKGLGICSWAKEVAYDYYLEGIKMLEETMGR